MSVKIYHNYCITFWNNPAFLPQDVTLPNSINTMNFWHIFDSGSKFEILKPSSSWLTFGISKFVSLSISRFLFLFLQLFFTLCCHIPTLCYHFGYCISILLSFWLLHLKITTILAITPQNYFGYIISNLSLFGYSTSKFILYLLYQTQQSIPTAMSDTIAVSLKPYSH